jgi:hypothetical protein
MQQDKIKGSRGPGRRPAGPSKASRQLDRILANGGPVVKAIRKNFHRSQLRKYRRGQVRPELEGMMLLRRLTQPEDPIEVESWALKVRA